MERDGGLFLWKSRGSLAKRAGQRGIFDFQSSDHNLTDQIRSALIWIGTRTLSLGSKAYGHDLTYHRSNPCRGIRDPRLRSVSSKRCRNSNRGRPIRHRWSTAPRALIQSAIADHTMDGLEWIWPKRYSPSNFTHLPHIQRSGAIPPRSSP
jgi:hypothetical protein